MTLNRTASRKSNKGKNPRSKRWGSGSRVIIPRKKSSPLNRLRDVPYKDVELLKQYLTERGRILPRRISGNTAYVQRSLTQAIKRARQLALISPSEGYRPQVDPPVRHFSERPPRPHSGRMERPQGQHPHQEEHRGHQMERPQGQYPSQARHRGHQMERPSGQHPSQARHRGHQMERPPGQQAGQAPATGHAPLRERPPAGQPTAVTSPESTGAETTSAVTTSPETTGTNT